VFPCCSLFTTGPIAPTRSGFALGGGRQPGLFLGMRTFNVVIERDPDTGLFVGHVPGWPGAHSQGESLDELQANLQEVVSMLLEDGEPKFESEFVAVQTIRVA
jgi:predicted RNase H-like HicB family nuclease